MIKTKPLVSRVIFIDFFDGLSLNNAYRLFLENSWKYSTAVEPFFPSHVAGNYHMNLELFICCTIY